MKSFLLVALGGALGAAARYGLGVVILRVWTRPLPLATLSVNLLGCFLIGLLFPLAAQHGPLRTLAVVGFLGAFTTFSTFSLDTLVLLEGGHGGAAVANVVGSVVLGLLLTWLGLYLGRMLA